MTVNATDGAKELASEYGIDITLVGEPGARITKPDVQAYIEANMADSALPTDEVDEPEEPSGDDEAIYEDSRNSETPMCPVHRCKMTRQKTGQRFQHFVCPVDGCEERESKARQPKRFLDNPVRCPRRICNGKAMEYVANLSTNTQWAFRCPSCGDVSKVVEPSYRAMMVSKNRKRAEAAD